MTSSCSSHCDRAGCDTAAETRTRLSAMLGLSQLHLFTYDSSLCLHMSEEAGGARGVTACWSNSFGFEAAGFLPGAFKVIDI